MSYLQRDLGQRLAASFMAQSRPGNRYLLGYVARGNRLVLLVGQKKARRDRRKERLQALALGAGERMAASQAAINRQSEPVARRKCRERYFRSVVLLN